MSNHKNITITITSTIDCKEAEYVAEKLRSVVLNSIDQVTLQFNKDIDITSAGFLGFLISTGKHMKNMGIKLLVSGLNGKNKLLFSISQLDEFVVDQDTLQRVQ